ncbi:hypothetical protein OROHE_025911 [Orobanche hederae]
MDDGIATAEDMVSQKESGSFVSKGKSSDLEKEPFSGFELPI